MKIDKRCPDCGDHLVVRENRQNGSEFIGCSNWPRCTHTEELPERLRLIAMGAQQLPGFE